jgi:hypothetical protein
MRSHSSSIILILLLAGCSTASYIPMEPNDNRFQKAKRSLAGAAGRLELHGGDFEVSDLELTNDFLHFMKQDSNQRWSVPLSDVYKIKISRPTRGVVLGMAGGFVVGAAFAGALSVLSLQAAFAPAHEVNQVVAVGAGIGLVGGAIYGYYHPPVDRYYFGRADEHIKPVSRPKPPPRPVTLHMSILPEETATAVRIVWNGHDLWLKRSDITIERKDDGIWLTVPGHLLE